jgi:hypothetical protein
MIFSVAHMLLRRPLLLNGGRGDKRQSFILWVRHSHVRQVPDLDLFLHCRRHNTENSKPILSEKELRGLHPIFHIPCVCER